MLALRLGDPADPQAAGDARTFAKLPFARGRGGEPVDVAGAAVAVDESRQPIEVLILEADAGPAAQAAVEWFDARVVLVVRGNPSADMSALSGAAQDLGERLRGIVLTAVPKKQMATARTGVSDAGLPLLAALEEDQTLYAPSIGDLIDALNAEVILGEPDFDDTVVNLLINPVTADPGQPYYARRGHKAVITRSDKTDLQLAALHSQTDVLILTGGLPPSPYTIDRAAGEEVPLLLTQADTRRAVQLLEDIYVTSRFTGELKLERMRELLGQQVFEDSLAALLV